MTGLLPLVLGAAAVCGVLTLAAPAAVRRLPEPDPGPDPTERDGPDVDPPKEPYAAIADRRWFAPTTVVLAAVAGGLLAWGVGATWSLLVLLVLVPPGVALAVVDWRTRLLPTRLIAPTYAVMVPVVLLGWVVTGSADGALGALLGWLVVGGLYLLLWFVSPRSLGYGDVRLSGLLGIALGHLGWGPLLLGVWLGFAVMGVAGLLLRYLDPLKRKAYPFGPFMLLGALLGVLLSPWVVPAVG